jgi:pyrroloquinoline quinone (PQQ) biosynthesis protein C
MTRDDVHDLIERALEGRRLLEHPFYRRWEAGALCEGELAAYAEQYRHVERALPSVLSAVAGGLADGEARDLVAANLADEESVPEPHVALFESFAGAVGARGEAAPTPATAALVDLERSAAAADPVAALAMVCAYEVQAAEIAATKSAGLSAHYGVGPAGTRFWDVHAEMESAHAGWSVRALADLAPDPAGLLDAAVAGAGAWWAFLDEREAMAPAPA